MKKALKTKDINFNDEKQVAKLRDEVVEISVGTLASLLEFFYTGGGEPDDKNKRLQLAERFNLAEKYAADR